MSKKNLGWFLLSSASLAAMGAMSPAWAQDASPQPAQTSDEIVVTATGRSAAIQDVPLAVTAVTGETLQNAGVSDIRDLQQLAPSYRFYTGQSSVASTTAYIRGIGTGSDSPSFESAVGFFIDGVYRSRSGIALEGLPDIERVEVLRGPQGTLFGRNTSAGAVSIVTPTPEFDPHFWMSASTGNLGLLSGQFGAEGAIIADKLAGRIDFTGEERDGYIHDVNSGRDYDNRNRYSTRGQLLWDISNEASLRIIADYAHEDEDCCAAVTIAAPTNVQALLNGIAALGGNTGILNPNPSARDGAFSPNRAYNETVDDRGISGQLDWDLGFADLTSITAYRNWDSSRKQDIDFSGLDRAYRDGWKNGFETTTEELRLHGKSGILDWLVGGFYINEDMHLLDTVRVGTQAELYPDLVAATQDVSPVPGQAYPGLPAGADGLTLFGPAGSSVAFDGATCLPIFTPGTSIIQAAAALGAWQSQAAAGCATQQFYASHAYADTSGPFAGARAFATALNALGAPQDGQGQTDYWKTNTTGYALFTHDEISLSDQLVLTLGARWNHEEKDLTADLHSTITACSILRSVIGTPLQGVLQSSLSPLVQLACNVAIDNQSDGHWADSDSNDAWSGTASLAYHISPDLMLYGGYSRGFKDGGFNTDRESFHYTLTTCLPADDGGLGVCTPVTPSTKDLLFKPEFTDAYELGFKSTLFGGSTYLNANLFLEKVHDYQENAFSGFDFITFNVPESVSKGVEVDFLTRPTRNLTIQSGLVYDDAYFDSTVLSGAVPLVSKGQQFAQAPKWSATTSFTYTQPLGDGLQALFYLDGRYNSEYPTQTIPPIIPESHQSAYTILNARVGIGAENGRWSLEGWVHNLTDKFYQIGAFGVPEQSGLGVYATYPNEPRTFGITLRARY
ncbi:MAG: TonB-dependent receptor [Pseudomonadota bacterium]